MKYVFVFFSMLVTTIGSTQSLSPQVVATSGGFFDSGVNSLSWTLGESVIQTVSSPNNILTQGFQQSNYTITFIGNLPGQHLIKIYPNPAADYFYVDLESAVSGKFILKIIDIYGRIHHIEPLVTSRQIDVTNYIPGIYYIQIVDGKNLPIYSYKLQIIKE